MNQGYMQIRDKLFVFLCADDNWSQQCQADSGIIKLTSTEVKLGRSTTVQIA